MTDGQSAPATPPASPFIGGEDEAKKEPLLSRRDFIKTSVKLAVAGALVPGALSQLLPAVAPAALSSSGAAPVIKRDPATNAKIPVTIADLAGAPPVYVTAEWNFLPATVYKVKKAIVEKSAAKRGYNTAQFAVQHPTEDDHVILLYRTKCKHLGCTVGFNTGLGASKDIPDYDGDGLPDGRILCPCHQGQYDIHDLAKNQPGTPPPAPLDVIRFNVGNFAEDVPNKIPAASNAIIGAELIPQTKYRDADLDSKAGNKAYKLGSQAAVLGAK